MHTHTDTDSHTLAHPHPQAHTVTLTYTHTQTHGAHDLPGPERAYSCTLTVCPPWTEPHPSCAGQASPPTRQPPEGTPSAPLDNGAEAWAGGAPGPPSHTRAEWRFGGRPASTAGTQSCLHRGAPAIAPPVTLRTGEPTCSRPKPHLNEAGPAEGPAQTSTLTVASVVKCGSRLPGMALSQARPPRGPGTPTRCIRARPPRGPRHEHEAHTGTPTPRTQHAVHTGHSRPLSAAQAADSNLPNGTVVPGELEKPPSHLDSREHSGMGQWGSSGLLWDSG